MLVHTFRALIQKLAVKLDELPGQAHCTVTGVGMRRRLPKWSRSWELGSHRLKLLSQCLGEPGELTHTAASEPRGDKVGER